MQKDTLGNYSARRGARLSGHTRVVWERSPHHCPRSDAGSTNDWHPIKSLLRKRLRLPSLELIDRRWAQPSHYIPNYPGRVSFFHFLRSLADCKSWTRMAQLSPCYNSLLNRDTQQEEWRDFPLLNSEEMDLDCRRVHVKLSERLGVSSAEPISLCTWMDKDEDAEQRKSNSLQAFTSLMRRPQPPPKKKN